MDVEGQVRIWDDGADAPFQYMPVGHAFTFEAEVAAKQGLRIACADYDIEEPELFWLASTAQSRLLRARGEAVLGKNFRPMGLSNQRDQMIALDATLGAKDACDTAAHEVFHCANREASEDEAEDYGRKVARLIDSYVMLGKSPRVFGDDWGLVDVHEKARPGDVRKLKGGGAEVNVSHVRPPRFVPIRNAVLLG